MIGVIEYPGKFKSMRGILSVGRMIGDIQSSCTLRTEIGTEICRTHKATTTFIIQKPSIPDIKQNPTQSLILKAMPWRINNQIQRTINSKSKKGTEILTLEVPE